MKVLILSVTAGGGHNSTAAAIEQELKANGAECRVLDTLKYINSVLGFTVAEGYLFVTRYFGPLYGSSYRIAERRRHGGPDHNSPVRLEWATVSRRLRTYIGEYDPDVIVYTHVFVGIMLDTIKVKHGLRAKTVGILTDFVFHPYWEEAQHTDFVVTADRALDYRGQRKGFRPEQLLPFGIPVNPKFAVAGDRGAARLRLGLDPDRPTVLLMGGSMGYGNLARTVEQLDALDADFQLIAVCGNNKSAREELERAVAAKRFRRRTLPLGFVSNVDVLMDASELLITKPGGLTVSEALCKRLPMVLINPIPGQEDRNTDFLRNYGAAVAVSKDYPLEEAVYTLISSPDRLRIMTEAIDLLRKPNATRDIVGFVMNLK